MKIYDITQELFSCVVFPGDPAPKRQILAETAKGDLYNLTTFSMCAHNGTHVDAPFHFVGDGKTIDQLDLTALVGMCYVAEHTGTLSAEDAHAIVEKAIALDPESAKRILVKGKAVISADAAKVFAEAGLVLVGNESQTVGPEDAPMAVHLILLGADMILLEGVRLGHVPEGLYFLSAAPLNLGGADGAPCRALLIEGLRREG